MMKMLSMGDLSTNQNAGCADKDINGTKECL